MIASGTSYVDNEHTGAFTGRDFIDYLRERMRDSGSGLDLVDAKLGRTPDGLVWILTVMRHPSRVDILHAEMSGGNDPYSVVSAMDICRRLSAWEAEGWIWIMKGEWVQEETHSAPWDQPDMQAEVDALGVLVDLCEQLHEAGASDDTLRAAWDAWREWRRTNRGTSR